MMQYAVSGYAPFYDVKLIVFPEFAHAAPIYDSVAKLRERLAVELPNEHTDRYAALARKHGCWIQTGSFLENDPARPDADTLVVDKTGTLTTGKLALIAVLPLGRQSRARCLAIAAALEATSRHPVGTALLRASQPRSA